MERRVLSLAACSDSTGPSITLAGTWRFTYNNMSGSMEGVTVSCSVGSLDFDITRSGSTFSGVQVGSARLTCVALGEEIVDTLVGGESMVNGQVSGNTMSFRLGSISGQNIGTVSGSSISGSAQWVFASGNTTFTLSGEFTAVRL